MKHFKGFAIPYFVFLLIFAVFPVLLMLLLSFLDSQGAMLSTATFSLESFQRLADPAVWKAMGNSLYVAVLTVIICILLGYPTAYFISFSHLKHKMLVLLLLILPMWSNSMLRIVSWLRLLSTPGLASLHALGSYWAVIFVSVTTYLPFMIFPIYTVLEKLPRSLIEASKDLGVPAPKTFFKVTLPLSMQGVYSGIIMVFLPAATGFAISQTIGQGKVRLIGNLLESVFEKNNFNFGSVLSLLLSIILVALLAFFDRLGNKKKKEARHA